MASLVDLECAAEGVKPSVCTSSFLFRCELNSTTQSYTFKVSDEDDSDHILALNMICLSEGAKDECNIVEFVGHNYQDQEIVVPVANLKLSCLPSLCLENFELQPPVTFRLRSGSGPVHLSGQHEIFHKKDFSEGDEDFSMEDESMEEEEEEEEEEELSPLKPAKKQCRS